MPEERRKRLKGAAAAEALLAPEGAQDSGQAPEVGSARARPRLAA